MARHVRHRFESRTARLKLAVRKKPYAGPSLASGVTLLYRRNRGNGTFIVKALGTDGKYWTRRVADADDFAEANGDAVLTFFAASDRARELARGDADDKPADAPVTLDEALTAYSADLEARAASVENVSRVRYRLPAKLAALPVAMLTAKELARFRNSLLDKSKDLIADKAPRRLMPKSAKGGGRDRAKKKRLTPASVNRLCNGLRAALRLAGANPEAVKALEALPDGQRARNVVLDDDTVRKLVVAAYARDHAFGLLVDVLATTGTRASQAARLRCEDLIAEKIPPAVQWRLLMPKSAKGGGRDRAKKLHENTPIPIPTALAEKLVAATADRAPSDALLLRANGRPWGGDPEQAYRDDWRTIVAEAGLDLKEVTAYALRHSSITRMLLRNVPIRLVADLHNTSVNMIEKTYSKNIARHGEDLARAALLDTGAASRLDPKVVSISGRH